LLILSNVLNDVLATFKKPPKQTLASVLSNVYSVAKTP
jgi:hypothetical protein